MKTLIIVASARKGSSFYIGEQIKNNVNKENVKLLQLSDYMISYCTGCLECDETHRCNIHDGMDIILKEVLMAETLVFITPVRYSLLSGDGKVFIDRLNPTAVSGDIEGKGIIVVAVGQSQKDDEVDSISLAAKSVVSFANNAGLNVLGEYTIYDCYGKDDIKGNEDVRRVCDEISSIIQGYGIQSNK